MLDGFDGIAASWVVYCFYIQIGIMLALMIKALPLKVEKTVKILYTDEIEEPLQEVPQGMWRCMGCGKILSLEISRCECGYKYND